MGADHRYPNAVLSQMRSLAIGIASLGYAVDRYSPIHKNIMTELKNRALRIMLANDPLSVGMIHVARHGILDETEKIDPDNPDLDKIEAYIKVLGTIILPEFYRINIKEMIQD